MCMKSIKANIYTYRYEEKDGEILMDRANYEEFEKNEGAILKVLSELFKLHDSLSSKGKKVLKDCIKDFYENQ